MPSLRILFRPSSRQGRHLGRLYIRLIHEREIKDLSTSHQIYSDEWNKSEKCIQFLGASFSRRSELEVLEGKLNHELNSLKNIIQSYSGRSYTLDDLLFDYKLIQNSNSLYLFVEYLSKGLLKEDRARTARAYRTAERKLRKFNQGKDLSLDAINSSLIRRFENSLRNSALSLNTISFYIRNLRSIYNKAISHKRIVEQIENPFSGSYTKVQITKKRALSAEELTNIFNLDLSKCLRQEEECKKKIVSLDNLVHKERNLSLARDLFQFSFYARGMSFIDLVHLKKKDIQNGIIIYYRRKTRQPLEIKLTDTLSSLINKYSDQTASSPYIFPIIQEGCRPSILQYEAALKRQNKDLKHLAKLAGVDKLISTHVARHTWATIAKKSNLPLWVISEGLGHSSVKTTYIYLASFEQSVLDEANEMVALAVG